MFRRPATAYHPRRWWWTMTTPKNPCKWTILNRWQQKGRKGLEECLKFQYLLGKAAQMLQRSTAVTGQEHFYLNKLFHWGPTNKGCNFVNRVPTQTIKRHLMQYKPKFSYPLSCWATAHTMQCAGKPRKWSPDPSWLPQDLCIAAFLMTEGIRGS